MNLQQRKLFIEENAEHIKALGRSSKMIKYLSDNGFIMTTKELFDELYPSKVHHCEKSKFVCMSVGYRSCARCCPCHLESVSKKISEIKNSYSPEKKLAVNKKRAGTNLDRHGVEYTSKLDSVREMRAQTKLERYGCETYNNRDKAKDTCSERYGVDNAAKTDTAQSAMKKTNMERYGVEHAVKSPTVRRKIVETLFDNYGVTVPAKSPVIVDRIKATCVEKYGVDNVRKSDEIKRIIRERAGAAIYERYLTHPKGTPLFTEEEYLAGAKGPWKCNTCGSTIDGSISNGNIPRCLVCMPYSISVFEVEVRDYVSSVYSGEVVFNNRKIIWPKEIDIYLPDIKLGIECNGIYRHTELTGCKSETYHSEKSIAASCAGVRLLHIDDAQWYHKSHIVKSIISHRLGLSTRIPAKGTDSVELTDRTTVIDFLESHNLHGAKEYDMAYGLVHGDEIVATMTLVKLASGGDWKIQQYCTAAGTTVVGGASKLMTFFRKSQSPKSVISHHDNMLGPSTVHTSLGMTKATIMPPDYQYYVGGKLHPRYKFGDWESMKAAGHDRMWDAGKTEWRAEL